MKLHKAKKIVAGVAASTAMVAGLAIAGTGTAVAADRYDGPTLKAEQGDFDGKNVKLTLTNPNKSEGFFSESSCTSALLDGAQGLEAFVAYNNNDFVKLLEIMATPGLRVGPSASNNLIKPGPNSKSTNIQVDTGIYVYVGTCGGIKSLEPGNVGVTVKPVIVPDGIGSLAPVSDFGSVALEAGVGSTTLLPLLGSLGGSAS
ncbi:hypothetical protein [Prescottella defluvii]|uniref:hypothetical protein n=1 Tax=Prescottella defluvii TaxID=1323361 RepID=UPI001E4A38B8|nr:hypothetical protein [Prescottella defluvii]